MTQKEKQIAIAKTHGTLINKGFIYDPDSQSSYGCPPEELLESPNYFNDLNACAELEAILTHGQYRKFAETLYFMEYKVDRKKPKIIGASRAVLSASAERRAEAIGQVLKLW